MTDWPNDRQDKIYASDVRSQGHNNNKKDIFNFFIVISMLKSKKWVLEIVCIHINEKSGVSRPSTRSHWVILIWYQIGWELLVCLFYFSATLKCISVDLYITDWIFFDWFLGVIPCGWPVVKYVKMDYEDTLQIS